MGITGRANLERQKCTQLSQSEPLPRTAVVGHEDAFPRPRLSGRCRFSQGTFAGASGNDKDAPKAVVSALLDWSPRGEAKRQINR